MASPALAEALLAALLISFLPTLYAAYSDRERGVGLLEPLVGSPPSAVELLRRLRVAQSVDGSSVWGPVSQWFVAVAQSHTAFPAPCSFPSQQPGLSWVVTAGTVLDSAALRLSLHRDQAAPLSLGRDADAAKDTARRPAPAVLVLAHGVPAITRVSRSADLDVPEPPGLMELSAGPQTSRLRYRSPAKSTTLPWWRSWRTASPRHLTAKPPI